MKLIRYSIDTAMSDEFYRATQICYQNIARGRGMSEVVPGGGGRVRSGRVFLGSRKKNQAIRAFDFTDYYAAGTIIIPARTVSRTYV